MDRSMELVCRIAAGVFALGLACMVSIPDAKADVFGVVVDTSESMQWRGNDPDHMALLGVVMLSDLLEPQNTRDELIAIPFDGAVTGPADRARAPVVLRSNFPPGSAGTDLFRDQLSKTIQYREANTHFAPALEQVINEVKSVQGTHENRVVILLTDGKPSDPAGELSAFENRIKPLARGAVQVWTIALGSAPTSDPMSKSAIEFFQRENLGGFEPAPRASDLLQAFAKVLSETTKREFEHHSLSAGQTYRFQALPTLDRSDWVVMMKRPGRIKEATGSVTQPGGKIWRPSGGQSAVREVNAVGMHPPLVHGPGKGTTPKARSHRRIRLQNPSAGQWEFKTTVPIELLAIHRNDFALKNTTEPVSTTGPVLRAVAGEPLCFRTQVTSLPSAVMPGQPITDPKTLSSLNVMIEIREMNGGPLATGGPTQLLDDGVSAPMTHDKTAADGVFGRCWVPTNTDVEKLFDVEVSLENLTTRKVETRAAFPRVEIIPRLELDLTPNPLPINGAMPMATNQTTTPCESVETGTKASLMTEINGIWQPEASFRVELGHRDSSGVWVEGGPRGEPVENVQVSIDGVPAQRVSIGTLRAVLGWEINWTHAQSEHAVCVTMGTRSSGGKSTKPLTLRFVPKDDTYDAYGIEFDLQLDISATEPSLWEQYRASILLATVLLLGVAFFFMSRKRPEIPPGVTLYVWQSLDRPPEPIDVASKNQNPYLNPDLGITIEMTSNGELKATGQEDRNIRISERFYYEPKGVWLRVARLFGDEDDMS